MAPARLQRFDDARLAELMSWFPDREACTVWGGPGFRFPFTAGTFRDDAKIDSLPTWALLDGAERLVGFGQYYLRVGRCHLGRLAIAPGLRGRGLGSTLVRELCRVGSSALAVDSYSLFVMPGNDRALRLYRRLGFVAEPYPEPSPQFAAATYLVAARPP